MYILPTKIFLLPSLKIWSQHRMMGRVGNFVLIKSSIKATCRSTFLKDMQKLIHENGKYCKIKHYEKIHYSDYFIQGTRNNKGCAAYSRNVVNQSTHSRKLGMARQSRPHIIVASLKKCVSAPSGVSRKLHSSAPCISQATYSSSTKSNRIVPLS